MFLLLRTLPTFCQIWTWWIFILFVSLAFGGIPIFPDDLPSLPGWGPPLRIMGHMASCYLNLREFVKTHVILAPLREFSRSRAASKIPFPGAQAGQPGQPGQPGEPEIFHFRCKNRYLRSRVI